MTDRFKGNDGDRRIDLIREVRSIVRGPTVVVLDPGNPKNINPYEDIETEMNKDKIKSASILSIESQKGSEAHMWLIKALNEAEKAVRLDNSKEFGKALFAYQNTILYLLGVLDKLSYSRINLKNGASVFDRKEKLRIIQLRDIYISRINVLLDNLPRSYSITYNSRVNTPKKMAISPCVDSHGVWTSSPQSWSSEIQSSPMSNQIKKRHFPRIHTRENSESPGLSPALKGETLASISKLPREEFSLRYPYWLMSQFAVSMVSGAHLTPTLYVPRELWSQKNCRIPAMEQKIEICNLIFIHLDRIQKVDLNDLHAAKRELGSCITALEHTQTLFSKRISTIDYHSRKKSFRQFSKLIEVGSTSSLDFPPSIIKGGLFESVGFAINKSIGFISDQINPKPSGLSLYTRSLFKVLCSAQVFNKWISHYRNASDSMSSEFTPIMEQLTTITLLFSSVICTFVLKDFHLVAERFIKKVSCSIFI